MIQVGQRKSPRYWGKFTVRKIVRLRKPIECLSEEKGVGLFEPTLVKIEWDRPPSKDRNEFWFPYWITFEGEEKYGQFAPMIGEKALLELLQSAINQSFFSKGFLKHLERTIANKLVG